MTRCIIFPYFTNSPSKNFLEMNSKSHIFSQVLKRIFQKIPPFSQNCKHKSHFQTTFTKPSGKTTHIKTVLPVLKTTQCFQNMHIRTHTHTAGINNDTTEHSLYTTSENRVYAAHKKKINVTFLQFSQKFSDYGDYLLRLGYILYLLLSCFPYSRVYYSSVLQFTHKSAHFLIYQWQVNQRMWQSLYTLIRFIQHKHFLIYFVH